MQKRRDFKGGVVFSPNGGWAAEVEKRGFPLEK
jgi:hypothetical protein